MLLRLPLSVEPVFLEWLQRTQPLKYDRVVSLIRQTRSGQMNDSEFRSRMRGSGPMAEQIRNMFKVFTKKHGLDQRLPALRCDLFRRPLPKSGQLRLF